MTMSQPDLQLSLDGARDDFRVSIDEGIAGEGVTAIFGRSGSGKSTLLRYIAGFESDLTIDRGAITFGADQWFDQASGLNVAPHKRGVGFMFQQPRLFAHLDVASNLEFARARARDHKSVVGWDNVVAAFALGDLLRRAPETLSGGESQRVALARTLLSAPRLLLLDEPLAALDDQHKQEMLPFLETLAREFELPVIYVSHDVEEVARLADHLLLLYRGGVVDRGPTAQVFARMDINSSTGRFDASVLLQAHVEALEEEWGLVRLQVAGQSLRVPARGDLKLHSQLRVRVRARDVAIALEQPAGLSIRNALLVKITRIKSAAQSPYADVWLALDDAQPSAILRAQITRAAA